MSQTALENEHQHIEWKESWHDDYLRWICGFANAQGGMLIIGRNDKGKVVGTHPCLSIRTWQTPSSEPE
jgi:predicted HTH transcriptional regulator